MAEYVDKEIAYARLSIFGMNVQKMVTELPKANVKEIIYAYWIDYQVPHISCCSYCDWGINPLDRSPYCPNCGAEMREVK